MSVFIADLFLETGGCFLSYIDFVLPCHHLSKYYINVPNIYVKNWSRKIIITNARYPELNITYYSESILDIKLK